MSDLDQTITGFDLWHLRLPVVSRRDHGIGTVSDACEIIVLRLTAEGGETGWGEASPWSVFTGSPEASFAALDRYIRPLVLGRPLADRAAIMAEADRAVAHATEAKAALEAALLDLTGHVAGLPVWALLGGRAQKEIPLSVSIANPDWEADRALIERLVADGVGIVKLKAGIKGHAFDILSARADPSATGPTCRSAWTTTRGSTPARPRPASGTSPPSAPAFIEQPVRADHFDAHGTSPRRRARAACSPTKASSGPKT